MRNPAEKPTNMKKDNGENLTKQTWRQTWSGMFSVVPTAQKETKYETELLQTGPPGLFL